MPDHLCGPPLWGVALILVVLPTGIRAQMYHATDLGNGVANAINQPGQVVGCIDGTAFMVDPLDTNSDGAPDTWFTDDNSDGVNDLMVLLGTLGGSESCATDINDNGVVVGWSEADCNLCAPGCTGSTTLGFVWQGDTMTPLCSPLNLVATGEAYAYGLDNSSPPRIVGGTNTNSSGSYPLVWQNILNNWTPLLLAHPGVFGVAFDINDAGRIVGQGLQFGTTRHGLFWDVLNPACFPPNPTGVADLGTLCCRDCQDSPTLACAACSGDTFCTSRALAINQQDTIVGFSYPVDPNFTEGFVYEDSGLLCPIAEPGDMRSVGLLIEPDTLFPKSKALDLNDCGQIVGQSSGNAFVWAGDNITDLNRLIGDSELDLCVAQGVNNLGQIVGQAKVGDDDRAFVLNPALDVVDPNPELLAGAAVTSKLQDLVGDARRVDGLAADGVTRIVLRMLVGPSAGQVTFEVQDDLGSGSTDHVGELSTRNGVVQNPQQAVLTVDAEEFGGIRVAAAILTAPVDFVRHGTAAEADDGCAVSRPLQVTAQYTPQGGDDCGAAFTVQRSLELYRPPIMFIHGIFGTRNTWGWCFAPPDGGGCSPSACDALADVGYNHSYVQTNAESFATNLEEPRAGIAGAVNQLRDLDVAVTQADVFAHSMGGVLTRLYAADLDGIYRRDNTFGAGDIHKLVTVDSPHLGSPLGCVLLDNSTGSTKLLGRVVAPLFGCMDCGALFDMLPEEQAFASSIEDILMANGEDSARLPAVNVPVEVLIGTGGSDFLSQVPEDSCGAEAAIALLLRSTLRGFCHMVCGPLCGAICDPANWFERWYSQDQSTENECGGGHPQPCHDIAVSLSSQMGGLDFDTQIGAANRFHCIDGVHISPGVPGSVSAGDRAIELLNAAIDTFNPSLPQASPETCPAQTAQISSPARSRGLRGQTGILITSPLSGNTFAPGATLNVTVEPQGGYAPVHVLALSGDSADEVDCGDCNPASLSLTILDEDVGILTVSSFAYESHDDVENTFAASPAVQVKIVPQAVVQCVRSTPETLYLFDYAPRSRIQLFADYNDGVTREISGCRVPECCDETCDEYDTEECGAFRQEVTYAVTDESVATVDCQGFVTARTAGRTTVHGTYNGQTYGSCTPVEGCSCTGATEVVVVSIPCDTTGDGKVGRQDYLAFQACLSNPVPECVEAFDFDGSGAIDAADFDALLACFTDPLCDCDNNGLADLEEVFQGIATDLNANGVPDVCEPTSGGLELIANGAFQLEELEPWLFTGLGQSAVEDLDCQDRALRITHDAGAGGSLVQQPIESTGLQAAGLIELNFDVRIASQEQSPGYPANVWIEYADSQGQPQTLQRSFCLNGPSCTSQSGEQISVQQIEAGTWSHHSELLNELAIPQVAEIVDVRLGGQTTAFDVAFDNVSLRVGGADCNANGQVDGLDVAAGSEQDCNGNWIPDSCEKLRLHVDPQAGGTGDGSSWENAFTDLQPALMAAEGELAEIWVAAGIYRPTTPFGERSISFQLHNCVEVYGGFEGSETTLEDRRPSENLSVLSGDLNDDDDTVGNSENSYHVVAATAVDATAVLDGFTITAGHANLTSAGFSLGGGSYNNSAAPTIANCRFLGNQAVSGGALYSGPDSNPRVVNCTFSGNAGSSLGGAVYSEGSLELINCTFSANSADAGGGMMMLLGSALIRNCIWWGNTDSGGSDESAQIDLFGATADIAYSCIQGWTGALGGVGNIGGDPNLVDADGADNQAGTTDDDLQVENFSPVIDAGENLAVPPGIVRDLSDEPRFLFDGLIVPSGNGTPPVVDMGAFEHVPDCNNNNIFDLEDIITGFSADVDGDGVPDECQGPGACCDAEAPFTCNGFTALPDCPEVWLGPGSACSDCIHLACGGSAGDCYDPPGNGTPGCDNVDCCAQVCDVDPFCCQFAWDHTCAALANAACNCPSCPDFTGDGFVNAADLALLLGAWGVPGCGGQTPCCMDGDSNGVVNATDLAQMLGAWGPCP